MFKKHTQSLFTNFAVAAVIYAMSLATSWLFQTAEHGLPPIWPASGIALSAMLLLGGRVWIGIFLPLCISSLVAGDPWLCSVLSSAGMTLSIWLGTFLLRRQKFERKLSSTRDILLLAGLGVALPMALAGVWSATSLIIAGKIPATYLWTISSVFWVKKMAGAAVVAPVILLIAGGRFFPKGTRKRDLAKATAQLLLVFLSTWIAFRGENQGSLPLQALAYLPFPFLVWVALTRGLPTAALSVLIVVMTAAAFTSAGHGPFVTESTLFTIWQIEIFIAIVTTTGLLIGAGSEAQRREKILLAEAATRKAELERLKAQIHPHLLFNCLTTIHSLIRTDTTAAQAGLFSLSALLRKSLDVAKEPMIPLRLELEIIRSSLELDKMRFEEGLEWSVSADARAEDFPVPPMLLQPLIENAVKHGAFEGFGRVNLEAHMEGEDLLVLVSNTAPPESNPENWGESVGLASVRSRIADACAPGSTVHFSRTPGGLIQALVRIKRVVGNKP